MRIVLLFIMLQSIVYGQDNNKQLAYQYFQKGEYEKSILIYKDLSRKNSITSYYYPYFTCYFNLGRYKEARNLSQKMVKKFPKNLIYLVEVNICYLKEGNKKRSEKTFSLIKRKLKGNRSEIINIANRFIKYQMFKYALDIYQKSEQINSQLSFTFEKAQLYSMLGDQDKMVISYLKVVLEDERKKELVMLHLERFLDNDGIKSDKNYRLVKKHLLKYVQKEKERIDLSEMLIWLFMKHHQFKLAFIQAQALDKRLDEDGERIYNLAGIFANNEYYDIAIKAYDYVIQKGPENHLFINANINRLDVLSRSIPREHSLLNQLYQELIEELGYNRKTIRLLLSYANFKAFSLYDLESSARILEDAMKIRLAKKIDIAKCKLKYADIMLASNKVWESILFYSQVEKEFKENPLGHQAKFKRAKVAFFQGDFDWAQAQLEVLKSSTSKLISNDAMKLSLLITDNLGLDTTTNIMKIFARAEFLSFQNKLAEALVTYDSIIHSFPGHSLIDEIYFAKSDIFFKQNEIDKIILMLVTIIEEFPYDILGDDATFQLAKIYELRSKDNKEAMRLYENILTNYKGSIYTIEARKRYRELRGDYIKNEEL